MDAYELIKTVYFGGNEAVYICSKCGALHLRDQVCSGCGNDSGDDMVADVNVDVLAIQQLYNNDYKKREWLKLFPFLFLRNPLNMVKVLLSLPETITKSITFA